MAKSVEELGKQLDTLQARVVAAEKENKKLRERAETAGITAAGTAGRAERFNVQGVSGDNGGNLYFNSGRYSNRTPPKILNDPGKVISWLRRMPLFLGSEGLEHTISLNPTCPVHVISCKDRDVLVSIHGKKLVADHQKAWRYLLEATCNTEIEEKLVAYSCVPEVWEVIQGWSLPTINSDSSGVTISFYSGHRRDGSDFPVGGVGQQHGSWNRHQPPQPQFAVRQQHN